MISRMIVSLYQYQRASDLTLKLKTTAAELYAGDEQTVEAKVILGTNGVTWSSSNDAVATVKDGVITGAFPPCGVCRQALAEFADEELCVLLVRDENDVQMYRLGDLLPASFTKKAL